MRTTSSLPPPRFQVFIGFHTDVGRQRQKNEDALIEVGVPLGYLIAVADGMGGHDYGERAAVLTLDTVHSQVQRAGESPASALVDALRVANAAVHSEASKLGRTMGATCVAALISSGKLYVVHAGDARAYLLRASTLYPLTRDHSFVQEIADTKGPVIAGNLPQNFSHIVSRSLGTQPTVEVCSREPISLTAGDVVLLCSDGLTNMVDETRVRATLAGATPREAARRLVDMANEAGGHDNVTVIVARIDTELSLMDTQFIGAADLRSMFVRTTDGQLHPIVNGLFDPTTWTMTAVVIDLRNVKKGATVTLATSEMGPVVYGKQAINIPQSTEALAEMGERGMWRSDAKQSAPPSRTGGHDEG
ncbi:MAG: protein phosphatase 2C domain-containing protein [Burkholderiaceae bacterium]|nr:protein phosphatase 2C domain-containing protein [Burkholderiaceae bacterium]